MLRLVSAIAFVAVAVTLVVPARALHRLLDGTNDQGDPLYNGPEDGVA